MKKTVFAFLIALVGLFSVSCGNGGNKTSKLLGDWEVEEIQCYSTDDGSRDSIYGDFINRLSFKSDCVVDVVYATLIPKEELYNNPSEAWYTDTFKRHLELYYIEDGKISLEGHYSQVGYGFELKDGKLVYTLNDEPYRNRETKITYKKIK